MKVSLKVLFLLSIVLLCVQAMGQENDPEQLVKRMTTTLERCVKVLTPELRKDFRRLPQDIRENFFEAASDLAECVKHLK